MNRQNTALQAEALQLAAYCNIIRDILEKYRSMSVIKLFVFSYIIKKQEILQVKCFSNKDTNDLVLKALSQIAGRYNELLSQLPLVLRAIDLLVQNKVCEIHSSEVMCLLPQGSSLRATNGFIYSAIEESYLSSDRQFLKEVISIV